METTMETTVYLIFKKFQCTIAEYFDASSDNPLAFFHQDDYRHSGQTIQFSSL